MDFLLYRSKALVPTPSEAVREIVSLSVIRNAATDLTGFLHAEDGMFIQYLEGPSLALWALYDHLHHDARHRNLTLLAEGTIKRRRFHDWRMGYSARSVMCFADFLNDIYGRSRPEDANGNEALIFLMAVCQRIDLGICEQP
ncbi:BLUF domain-containing protein [Loktanella sp. M215]|uniref:BLUF domain-containing protein n=1 Tax=Loktanella sp. M215 TaxID=2675431 RepID=UPI001F3120CD|nr:BLUF domain-containing protein [Loktanella sp. M215]MCF7700498.1 hypothetical protein [Loktanella sp. M215]